MARIRSIKPEFFSHEELFDLEQETGFPVRLAFAGLWTVADREGRFKWRPRTIKLDVLPYDEVDFAALLDALSGAGFVQRYAVDGEEYGWIRSFPEHQHVNVREPQSKIPDPTDADPVPPRANPVPARGEGKGREIEGKGKEGKEEGRVTAPARPDADPDIDLAFRAFNDLASEVGLAKAQLLNPTRRKALTARLAECGGIDGWRTAIKNIRGSPFLLGHNDRGWKADFDFVLQAKSFTKIMEGSYGAGGSSGGGGSGDAIRRGLASAFVVGGVEGRPIGAGVA